MLKLRYYAVPVPKSICFDVLLPVVRTPEGSRFVMDCSVVELASYCDNLFEVCGPV